MKHIKEEEILKTDLNIQSSYHNKDENAEELKDFFPHFEHIGA